MNNKKALLQVVTTVIFISLALIAIGIVWAVIQGLIQGGASDVSVNSKCLKVDLSIDGASCNDTTHVCTVVVKRNAGGEVLSGVKVQVLNASGSSSGVIESKTALNELETKTITVSIPSNSNVTKANKVEVTPYFNDAENVAFACPSTAEFNIVA